MVSFALFAAAANLLVGTAAEITSGTFIPSEGNRFRADAPEQPGDELRDTVPLLRHLREDFQGNAKADAAACGLGLRVPFLFLTKSRTSLAAAVLASGVLGARSSSLPEDRAFLGIVWAVCFSLLFLPDGAVFSFASAPCFRGGKRPTSGPSPDERHLGSVPFVHRRAPSPRLRFRFLLDRRPDPVLRRHGGLGGQPRHSTYIDIALSLGIAGLVLYVLMLASGILRSARLFVATRRPGFGSFSPCSCTARLTDCSKPRFPTRDS
jgi:hypothetical protein